MEINIRWERGSDLGAHGAERRKPIGYSTQR